MNIRKGFYLIIFILMKVPELYFFQISIMTIALQPEDSYHENIDKISYFSAYNTDVV